MGPRYDKKKRIESDLNKEKNKYGFEFPKNYRSETHTNLNFHQINTPQQHNFSTYKENDSNF